MADGGSIGVAGAAWVVAAALAVGLGGLVLAVSAVRRARRAEARFRALEAAVAEFCSALRTRLLAERNRIVWRAASGEADPAEPGAERSPYKGQAGGSRPAASCSASIPLNSKWAGSTSSPSPEQQRPSA